MSKVKHTVEIVAEMGADALVAFLKRCSTWSTEPKVIKSEPVRPPIKIGDKLRHCQANTVYEVLGINETEGLYWVRDTLRRMATVTQAYINGLERLDD